MHRSRHVIVAGALAALLAGGVLIAWPTQASDPVQPAVEEARQVQAQKPVVVPKAPDSCHLWTRHETLQAAVEHFSCVRIPQGTHVLNAPVKIPQGHTLTGEPGARDTTWLIANARSGWWNVNPNNGMLGAKAVPGKHMKQKPIVIEGFSISGGAHFDPHYEKQLHDGAHIGITTPNAFIDNMHITKMRCNGVRMYGAGVQGLAQKGGLAAVVTNTLIDHNGAECIPSSSPPGAGAYLQDSGGETTGKIYFKNDQIINNDGPAIDVNGVNYGVVTDSVLTNALHYRYGKHVWTSQGWATVSLGSASGWTISNSRIAAPNLVKGHSGCRASKAKQPFDTPGAAGVLICGRDHDATGNTIINNQIQGRFGIVVVAVGARANENRIIGNRILASKLRCGESRSAAVGKYANYWNYNSCVSRRPNSMPRRF